jgi:hypothetical protein
MVDLSNLKPTAEPTPLTTQTAPTDNLAPVAATIETVPDKLASVSRPVQLTGPIVNFQENLTLTLATALGNIVLEIAPDLTANLQQANLSTLIASLAQSGKTVSVQIQPGTPPNQAILQIPLQLPATEAPAASAPSVLYATPNASAPAQLPQILSEGTVLNAFVLPKQIDGNLQPLIETIPLTPKALPTEVQTQPPSHQRPLNPALALLSSPHGPIVAPIVGDEDIASAVTLLTKSLAPTYTAPQTSQQPPSVGTETLEIVPTTTTLKNAQVPLPPLSLDMEKASLNKAWADQILDAPSPDTSAVVLTKAQEERATTPPSEAKAKTPAGQLQVSANLVLTVKKTLLPDASPPQIKADEKVATVIGKGPQGQVLLNLQDQTLLVKQVLSLPVGAKLVVEVRTTADDAVILSSPSLPDPSKPLQNILESLNAVAPQVAERFIQTSVPQANTQLGATLVFFLSAINKNAAAWLDKETSASLQKSGHHGLVDDLIQNLSQNAGTVQDSNAGLWRSFQVPFFHQGQFQTLYFYSRRDKSKSGADESKSTREDQRTRFLINLRPSRLGAMQIDGLSQKKKLDIILRSETRLPEPLPQELRDHYLKTIGALGLTGTIQFKTGQSDWIFIRPLAKEGGVMT